MREEGVWDRRGNMGLVYKNELGTIGSGSRMDSGTTMGAMDMVQH